MAPTGVLKDFCGGDQYMSDKYKKVLKLISVQTLVFFALMILGDLLLWVVAPIEDGPPPLHIKLRQNMPGLKPEIVVERIFNHLRALSIRSLTKPTGSMRILCLGASTTNQITQETQDTWCALLEKQLNHVDPGAHVQTLSYGQAGDDVIDSALWIRGMIEQIRPDIVVTLLGINDLAWGKHEGSDIRTLIEQGRGQIGTLFYLKQLCTSISQVCRRVSIIKRNIAQREALRNGTAVEFQPLTLPQLRIAYQQLPYVPDVRRQPDPIDNFRLNLDWLMDFLHQRQVSVIVLGQPVLWKDVLTPKEYNTLWFSINTPNGLVRPATSWLVNEMHKYNRVQQQIAEKYGFTYVDLDAVIPKTLDYYFDDCHFTDSGSARVAGAVFPPLAQLLKARGIEFGRQASGSLPAAQ
jgi:lysophospholipase L1-like esterase